MKKDLVDQLFNSSESGSLGASDARHFGKEVCRRP